MSLSQANRDFSMLVDGFPPLSGGVLIYERKLTRQI